MPPTVVRVLVRLLFAVLAPFSADAQISDDIVKIGVLTDLSGPAATPTGPGSVVAAQMAADDFGGRVAGKPIVIVSADHQIKPDVGSAIARRWYDIEQVDLIVDVPVSAVGLAVQNVAKEKNKMLIVHSTGTADFHGKFCSPLTLQWVFDTRALAVGTAQEVVKRGGDTWFFLTADYAFGYSLEQQASEVIRANGGQVVGAVRHPFATPDLSSPPDNTNAIKLAGEFGLFQAGQQLAGLLVVITDVHALGLQAAQGLILTTSFYWDMDELTREWSKRFFANQNRMPTMWQAGVYSSIMNYLKAVEKIGTDDPFKVAGQMQATPVQDFFSRNGRLRSDGLMVHDLVLVQVKKPEESHYPWDYYQILTHIPGDQAFGPPDPACPIAKQ